MAPPEDEHLTRNENGLAARLFLMPGDLLCDAVGLRGESDHRQVLRSFFNMMIWGGIGAAVALQVML